MRISTSMLYSHGTQGFQSQASGLLQLQNQIGSGKRVVTPSDDPIAASSALVVTQAMNVNAQWTANRATAKDALSTVDTTLASVTDLVEYVKDRATQGGNGALGQDQLKAIASDLRARFDQMVGYANTNDPQSGYLFAGYRSNTQPFVGNVASGIGYAGDQGSRTIQVSDSRVLPTSNPGSQIFMNIPDVNGAFTTSAAATNTSSAMIDGGSVTGNYNGHAYQIKFTSAANYDILDVTSGSTVSSGTYINGSQISFGGIQVSIGGTPASGDSFDIKSGGSTDVFSTMQDLIHSLENDSGGALNSKLTQAMDRLDKTLNNVLSVRASVGSRINEAQSLDAAGDQANVQYKATLSRLLDVDYAQASSDLAQRMTALQASQQAFIKTTNLSLFNYI